MDRQHYVDQVLNHLEVVGPLGELHAGTLGVSAAHFPAKSNRSGVHLYCTVGAGLLSVPLSETGHRTELFAGFRPDERRAWERLIQAATFPYRHQEAIDHDHVIDFEEPLWSRTSMGGWWIRRMHARDFLPTLLLDDQSHVEFLEAIPVFPEEMALVEHGGGEELFAQWAAAGLDFSNPKRKLGLV